MGMRYSFLTNFKGTDLVEDFPRESTKALKAIDIGEGKGFHIQYPFLIGKNQILKVEMGTGGICMLGEST